MCGSMVDIQSAAAEIRRGKKKKKKDRNKPQGKNIIAAITMCQLCVHVVFQQRTDVATALTTRNINVL